MLKGAKILSEMEVAPCNKLHTLRILLKLLKLVTLFIKQKGYYAFTYDIAII